MTRLRIYGFVAILLIVNLLTVINTASAEQIVTHPAIKIVTSISPLADMVKNVGGNKVSVSYFVPLSVDPHNFEPTFSALKTISTAELIFLNGDGLDRMAQENLQTLKNEHSKIIDLSKSIPTSIKNGIDPHYWLDPLLAINYVNAITENLALFSPADRNYFERNAKSYVARIRSLDAKYFAKCSHLPHADCNLLLYHNAWTYLATRYGFKVIGIIEPLGSHDISARHLTQLIVSARHARVKAILSEPGHGTKILATIKDEANIPLILHMVEDSLIAPPYDTYLSMMDTNLKTLSESIGSSN